MKVKGLGVKSAAVFILAVFFFCEAFASEDPHETELLFMARKAYEDGFYEVSLEILERFHREYKDSAEAGQALLLSGQCYFYQGRYLEALSVFESLEKSPSSSGIKDALCFWTGEVHFKAGNYDKAVFFYRKLIENYPRSPFLPAAYYSLGWSYFQLSEFNPALENFKILIEKFPREPQSKDAAFKLIECLYNLKDYRGVKAKVDPVLKIYSGDAIRLSYLYFYLAESEYYLEDFAASGENYQKSAQASQDPKIRALAKLGLSWAYLKLARYKEAEDALAEVNPADLDKKNRDIFSLGKAILMSSTNRVYESKKIYALLAQESADPLILLQAYLGEGDALLNLSEYRQAIEVYRKGLDKAEGAGSGMPRELAEKMRYNLALAYFKQGETGEGAKIFDRMIAEAGDLDSKGSLLLQLAGIYGDAGDTLKAEGVYRRILDLSKEFPYADYAEYRIASAQLERGEYPRAAASFRKILKDYPRSKLLPDTLYGLGSAYFHGGDYAGSCEIFLKFRTVFKDNPLYARALYMLGSSFMELGKTKEALEAFNNLLKISPLDAELKQGAEYEAADCYYRLGEEREAVSRFKSLRSRYPSSKFTPSIMWWLGKYYYQVKNFDLARRYLDSLSKDFPESRFTAEAAYLLGEIYREGGALEKAEGEIKKAVKLGDEELRSRAAIALADIFVREGKPAAALEDYDAHIKENPALRSVFILQAARGYYQAGNYSEAKNIYRMALQEAIPSDAPDLHFELAEVYEALSEDQEAIREYITAAGLYSRDPQLSARSFLRAAKLYEDKEDYREALKIYLRVAERFPSLPESGVARERMEAIKK
ncbi:MAG: tetratricopeptide repeat protein [Candidatus Omnitrophica bacterium]|nr:tetratricopeptide repeat protein [Candidatus Omnitrophota bacterium]